MLRLSNIEEYTKVFQPKWCCEMPSGCPPHDILIPINHQFYRLARENNGYSSKDFMTYAELEPNKNWGELLPLAVGLSIIDNEAKARKSLKLPIFRKFKGIISLLLNESDGVVCQTGVHLSHYTWWRTQSFQMSNLKMLQR